MSWRRSSALPALAIFALPTAVAAQATEPAPTRISLPFDYTVVSGSEAVLAEQPAGQVLAATARVCLTEGQELAVSDGARVASFAGPGCLVPKAEAFSDIEDVAYDGSHVWMPYMGAISERLWACEAWVVAASGPSAADYPVGSKLDGDARLTLRAGDRVQIALMDDDRTLSGPGSYRLCPSEALSRVTSAMLTRQRPAMRVRTGAVRSGGEAPPKLVVVRGTAGALKRYPRASLVRTRICLDGGEQLRVAGTDGSSATYAGPGCDRLLPRGAKDNTAAVAPG